MNNRISHAMSKLVYACTFAVFVSLMLITQISNVSAVQPEGNRSTIIILSEPDATNDGGRPRRGTVTIREFDFHYSGGLPQLGMNVQGLMWNCFGSPLYAGRENRFYVLWVETTTLDPIRVLPFATECNIGTFSTLFVDIPIAQDDIELLFIEPVTVTITLEEDDGTTQNVFPYADYVLRGTATY